MENIFNEHKISNNLSNRPFNFYMTFDMTNDLFNYLNVNLYADSTFDLCDYFHDNLFIENYNTLRWDLNPILKTNANGEYI
jgi:hypothetical protein